MKLSQVTAMIAVEMEIKNIFKTQKSAVPVMIK